MFLLADAAASLNDSLDAFLSLILEGAFFILIGTVISGFIDAYLPSNMMERLLPKNPVVAVLASAMLGILFPVCECAIVPVIRRLLAKGLPLSCALTYMLAAPIVNPVVFFSTVSAYAEWGAKFHPNDPGSFGYYIGFSRLLLALIVTVLAGLVILKTPIGLVLRSNILKSISENKTAATAAHPGTTGEGGPSRLVIAMRTAQRDFTDVSMYFVAGVALTSLFTTFVNREWIAPVSGNEWLATPLMMALAYVLSLCSTTDAFLAASLNNQFVLAAPMAFMVFGPMMDVKLTFMYSSIFKGRFVLILALSLFILIGFLCIQWPLPVNQTTLAK